MFLICCWLPLEVWGPTVAKGRAELSSCVLGARQTVRKGRLCLQKASPRLSSAQPEGWCWER